MKWRLLLKKWINSSQRISAKKQNAHLLKKHVHPEQTRINKSCKLEKFEKVTDNLSSYNAKTGQCKTMLIKRKKYAISPRLKEQKAIIN